MNKKKSAGADRRRRCEGEKMADKFLIIDGSSLIHRAFFALPPLTNRQGVHTGAVYGLCNMLLRLLEEVKPRYMAVAFDKSRTTFRTAMFAAYKGQRKPTPGELSEQFPLAARLLHDVGIRTLEADNYEADDIIGTLAAHAPEDVEVIIVTGDRDELQLIDARTRVFYTKRGISDIQVFDTAEFAAEYAGLAPGQLVELKALMGDASDNIPGVPGVGAKTALKLIVEYGSVERVLENADKIGGKALQAKLRENKEAALLSKKLAEIYTEVPLERDIAHYALRGAGEQARGIMQELGFRNMYERFAAVLNGAAADDAPHVEEEMPAEVTPLATADEAAAFFGALRPGVAVPLAVTLGGELPRLFCSRAELGVDGKVYVLDEDSRGWQYFYAWLAEPGLPKLTCDSKEIYKAALCQKKVVAGVEEDIALAGYLDDPGQTSHALRDLAARYLPRPLPSDCANIAALAPLLRERLAERELTTLYRELEMPLAPVLARMEYTGIRPDTELMEQLAEDINFRVAQLEQRAWEQAGENFNVKSPKQLGMILFEKLKLPVIKKLKSGYSTDVKVLEQLEGQHPLITTILEHRRLSKLQSTYLDGLILLGNPLTGRIHTHFQQTGTVTGRLSSTNPNLQNIPARTEEGRQIREIFVPGEGYDYLMSCDYSQVELRILACIAGDEVLLESFRSGQHVHARTAAEVYGAPLEEVTGQTRTRAKAANFGIVYGISDYGLARQLNVTRAEAAGYIESYFARYTGVKKYMDGMIELARRQGYVATLMGRRRYLPDIKNSNFNLRSFAERTAINTPIQGTAADIMKLAMIRVDRALAAAGLQTRILLQVHDELVLETTEREKDRAAELVRGAMEQAANLAVPLLADVKFGRTWAGAK